MSTTEPPRPFDTSPVEGRSGWWRRNWLKLIIASGVVVVACILFALAIWSAISGYTFRDLVSSGPGPFKPAGEGEVLVIVTDFDQTGEIIADNRIYRALSERVAESGLEKVRVERLEGVMPLAADEAVTVGKQYHATIVIWGTADNVAFEPRYEVIAHSDLIYYQMELESTVATADTASFNARVAQESPLEFEYLMLFSLGQIAFYSSECEEAVTLFGQALDLLPGFSRTDSLDPEVVYAYRGWAYYEQSEYEVAIADFNRAIDLNPEEAALHDNRGIARAGQGDLEGAIADFNRAIALDGEYANAYNNRGNAHKLQGDLDGAIADYSRAIELDPAFAALYNNRGNAHFVQGNLEEAIADFNRAIELDPEDALAYYNRGVVHQRQGDLEGAIADFDRAIELDPEDADAYNNRGLARAAQGNLEGAIADFSRAIALAPDHTPAYNNRGLVYYEQFKYKAAIADFSRAIELHPEYAAPYYNRAVIYDRQGNVEAALADYIQYLELEDTESQYTTRARERIEALRAE